MDSFSGHGLIYWALDLLGRTAYWCLDSSLSCSVFIRWANGIVVAHFDELDSREIFLTCSRLCNPLKYYTSDLIFAAFALASSHPKKSGSLEVEKFICDRSNPTDSTPRLKTILISLLIVS